MITAAIPHTAPVSLKPSEYRRRFFVEVFEGLVGSFIEGLIE